MKVIQFEFKGRKRIGIELPNGIFDYSSAMQSYIMLNRGEVVRQPDDVLDMLRQGLFTRKHLQELLDFAEEHDITKRHMHESYSRLLCPLPRPGKIVALGWNYAKHAAEGGFDAPKEPVYFSKSPACVIGPDDEVHVPKHVGRVDPEPELAIVIGRKATKVTREDAINYIAGYTCFNDVTAREMQRADMSQQRPWFRSKSLDTFGPLGPRIVTPEEFDWPPKVNVELRVNGQVRQKDTTANLLFSVPVILEAITSIITLEPGDLVSTGTPDGIAPIADGDEMVVSVSGIGELKNKVRFVD